MAKEKLVEVKFDEAKLRRIQNLLRGIPRAMPRVMSRAINKTTVTARAEAARKIAAEIRIKVSAVKKGMDLIRASFTRWQAEFGVYGQRIPLFQFGARQLKTGVSYVIDKGAPRKKIHSAFIQTMPSSGHVGVFKRRGLTRYPISQLFGPSLGYLFGTAGNIAREVTDEAYKKLDHNISVQVKLILDQMRTPG